MNLKLLSGFILSLLLVLLSSCGGDSEKRTNSTINSFSLDGVSYERLVQRLNDIDLRNSLNQILNSNPERSANVIASAIDNARTGVLSVSKFPDDPKRLRDAFEILSSAITQYESYGILEFEEYSFELIFNDVRALRAALAVKLNIEDDYTWALYNQNFADGIEPEFQIFAGLDSRKNPVKWVTNFQTDIPKAKVQGREAYSWMVSKPFNISEIRDPSFRFFTQYTVVAPNPKDTLKEVVEKAFQIYVILDLKPGENPEDIDESRKILQTYDINDLPLARDFHDAWVPFKSLEQYKNHRVSIGFLFDTRKIEETQYYIWDIFDFELWGSGVLKKPASVYSPDLNQDLGGFKSLSFVYAGNVWGKFNNGLSVQSGSTKTDAFLLTPMFAVPSDLDRLKVFYTEKLSGAEESIAEVLISKNYLGGLDPLHESVEWEVLSEDKNEDVDGESRSFDLSEFKGEQIVLAFRFKADADTNTRWEIQDFFFESEGADLVEVPYLAPDLDEKYRLALYDMISPESRKFEFIYADREQSPRWVRKADGSVISGFRGDKFEPARVVFPEVDLSGSSQNKVRIKQAMKHLKDEDALKVQVRVSCKGIDECENFWASIDFPEGVFQRFVDDVTVSPWVDIPEDFHGKKVEFSLFYKAESGNAPEWRVRHLEVGGLK